MMGHSIDECCKKGMLHGTLRDLHNLPVASQYRSMWHCSSKELEANSPSRTDGINWETESQLRISYCSFIQNMGIELGVPQLTIATAIMLCHRFYLRQSHAKNDWQTVATACIFLAAKIEETPCFLDKVVVMSYRMKHRKDPSAAQRIKLKEVFLKQKELILIGENLLLSTVNFDLNIHHPYKPLAAAIRKLKLKDEVPKVAWNFVNDWLRTTLCLQYKPHYIAAGSLYLAAKLYNVQLPSEKGCVWWQEFDINPRMLEVVVHQMMATLGYKKSFVDPMVVALTTHTKTPVVAKEALSSSPASCVLSHASSSACSSPMFDDLNGGDRKAVDNDHHRSFISAVKNVSASEKSEIQLQRPDSKSCPRSVIGNCEGQTKTEIHSLSRNDDVSLRNASFVIDKERIREKIKRRRWERQSGKVNAADYTSEDSLERDLESVILVPETEPARKLQKV